MVGRPRDGLAGHTETTFTALTGAPSIWAGMVSRTPPGVSSALRSGTRARPADRAMKPSRTASMAWRMVTAVRTSSA